MICFIISQPEVVRLVHACQVAKIHFLTLANFNCKAVFSLFYTMAKTYSKLGFLNGKYIFCSLKCTSIDQFSPLFKQA